MKRQPKKTRISLDCFPDEHVKIKIYATLHKKTISEYILDLVREGMSHERIQVASNPNDQNGDEMVFPVASLEKQASENS